jgi:hypothetical protein
MANSKGNIYIEADFDNIFSVNPNKIYDEFGNVQERLVNHEELVMYVNLECNLLPRTKLQVGEGVTDTITIATNRINFMNPGQKNSLDTAWTDAFLGTNIIKGDNLKNAKPGATNNSKQNDKFEENQSRLREGAQPTTDTALLGITAINYKINSSFLPEVTMVLEDVRGRALFESGDQSPYSVFFQMPYPIFYLTMKGWYGKAVRIPLQLMSFNTSFNSQNGNFNINLKFYGYRYSMISEIPPGALMALPHMYERNFSKLLTENPKSTTQTSDTITTTLGYDCIKNVYSRYKSKGLIDKDFPEYTVMEFINKLDQFQNNISKTLNDEDYDKLTQVQIYANNLSEFNKDLFTKVSSTEPSWANKYRRTLNPIKLILKKTSGSDEPPKSLYLYKIFENEKVKQTDQKAREDLSKILLEYKKKFSNLKLFESITFNIKESDFYISSPLPSDTVNWEETYRENFKKTATSSQDPEFVKFVNDTNL